MAELAVFNIAKSLLEQLSSPAKDELLLWYNSKTELDKLKNTVISIRDVLHDAEQRQNTDAAVKTWLSRLRDEMYEADDLFDSISTRALRRRVMSGNKILKETKLFFSKPKDAAFKISTAHKVKELREKLDGIAKDINQFGFIRRTVVDERPIVQRKKGSHSYIPGNELIGREKEKEELSRLLLEDGDDAKPVSVIAVVGIGGQGKTSLAQHLYNAKETEEFFDLQLWACVNDFSDLKVVLEEVTGVKTAGLNELQNMLRKRIYGKRFLLVLDDVWDDIRERWLGLKMLLDAGARGSKILMTTRVTTVAQNLGTGTPYSTLKELSDEHAWFLFEKMAFENDQEKDYQAKVEIGRKIVKKCANVPLAIRTMASYLYMKDKKHWSELVDNHAINTMRDHPQNMIMDVLKMSYDDLPSSLKQCFAYCSLFPKDHKFDRTTLIHLWMAQGLLQTSDENERFEDVGERYFEYLVQRCFFQDIREQYDGRTVCKMHDLFHDMAVQIGGTECLQMKKPEDIRGKSFRHLLVWDIEGLPLEGRGTRSLVSPVTGFAKGSLLDEVFLKFTSLRTLSLRHLDVDEIPSSIGKLVHLRYLDLRKSVKLKKLPDALCKLHNLLILRLGGCLSLINLPAELHKIISLRYLEIEGCGLTRMPPGLEQLTSLVMLDRLVVSKDGGGLRFLKQLNNLTAALRIELPTDLWIHCVADAEECMLQSKPKLTKLRISFDFQTANTFSSPCVECDPLLNSLQPANTLSLLRIEYFRGGKFPNWLSSLTNLAELELWHCRNCVDLPLLRELYQLKKLKLNSMDLVEYVVGDTCYDINPFFPLLDSLSIICMPRLKGWGMSSGGGEVCCGNQLSFPQLSNLELHFCPQLTCFPLCPVLETLSLYKVNVNVLTQLLRETMTRAHVANNYVELPSCSTLQTCSKLRILRLGKIEGLSLLPGEFKLLHDLRRLDISDCPNLKRDSLFRSLQHLSALQSLIFHGSFKMDLPDDETMDKEFMPWVSLTKLKMLAFEFGSDPQGAHLIKGLHHLTMLENLIIHKNVADEFDTQWTAPPNVTSLRIEWMNKVACLNGLIQKLNRLHYLDISFCNVDEHELDKLPWEDLKGLRGLVLNTRMKSFPEKCRHLTTLESLRISCCHELCSLPTWVSQLTSLTIFGCGELEEKCRKPVGSYWPLIQHIPHLTVGYLSETERER